MTVTKEHPQIVIAGGGFGGLYTALRLSQLPWDATCTPQITLIDQRDRFLFAPFLYELITGEMQTWEIAPPFEELLSGTGIRFQQSQVIGWDGEKQEILLHGASPLNYDRLVIALGGSPALPSIPGVKEYALPFRTLEDAYRVRQKLRLLEQGNPEKIRVAIVGGGYSGVELACKISDRLGAKGRVRIIERGEKILSSSADYNQQQAQKALEKRRIWVDLTTEVSEIGEQSISLLYKGQVDTIPVDLVLWTVGNQVSDFLRSLSLPQDTQGRLQTNHFLQVEGHPALYAIGDAAHHQDAGGKSVPMTAQVAFQQSDYCAWNVWASLRGRPLLPFRYQPLGEMLSLGLDDATVSGLGLQLTGPGAVLARRLVYLYRFPTWQQQLTVGMNWIVQPLLNLLETV